MEIKSENFYPNRISKIFLDWNTDMAEAENRMGMSSFQGNILYWILLQYANILINIIILCLCNFTFTTKVDKLNLNQKLNCDYTIIELIQSGACL